MAESFDELRMVGVVPVPKAPIATPVPQTEDPAPDQLLLGVVLILVALGIVMVYSASAVHAARKFGSSSYFLKRDVIYVAIGLIALWIAAHTDFSIYRRFAYPLLIFSLLLLVAVLLVGVRINGARRWFHLGPLSFQPTAIAKLSLMIYLAHSLAKKAEKIRSFTVGFVPHMMVCGLMMGLLLMQPDLGAAVILGLGTLLVLFIAGAQISYIVLAILVVAPVVYQAIVSTPWRTRRMLAFIDPWPFRHDVGYQVTQSLISIGSGGTTGVGLGDGKQKLFFLPEAWTDYVMASIGEELGFLGLVTVVLLFVVLLWRGARAALRARDAFGCYLGFGITVLFGLQALVNLGVALGALPNKGLPMPFVSFGGSTLVVDLFAMGILLNISMSNSLPQPSETERGWAHFGWGRFRQSKSNRRLPGGGRRVLIDTGSGVRRSREVTEETLAPPPL